MLRAVKYLCRQLWRWEVVGLLATAVFAAAGLAAIYGEQFTLAAVCFSCSITLVVFKTLSWDEVTNHQDRIWISLLTVFLGCLLLGAALYWVQYRIRVKKNVDVVSLNVTQPDRALFKDSEKQSAPPANSPALQIHKKREPKTQGVEPNNRPITPPPPEIKQDCVGSNCIAGNSYGTNTVINQVPEPLQINRTQTQQIAQGMTSYQGTSIDLEEDGMTSETRNLAEGLKQALSESGLNVNLTSAVMNFPLGSTRLPQGLTFFVGSDEETVAVSLATLLRKSGVLPDGRKISLIRDSQNSKRFMICISPSH
jgi:hypothetical protein